MPKPSFSGAAAGALSGASAGAPFGPYGAAIGGGIGGLTGLLSGGGKESKMKPFNPQSLESLQSLLYGGGFQDNPLYNVGNDYLQQLLSGSADAYKAFEAPLMQNFEQNIAPGIAERFAGFGTGGGASSSSALQNSLAQAGRNLQTDIGALRGGLQMQALPQALQYAQQPLQNSITAAGLIPSQYYERPGQAGFAQTAFPSFAQGFAQGAGRTFAGG